MFDGRPFSDEFQRCLLLGMLLENVGLDVALEVAKPNRWLAALAAKRSR